MQKMKDQRTLEAFSRLIRTLDDAVLRGPGATIAEKK